MTVEQIIGLLLILLVMGLGVLGSVIPGLPGTSVIFLAALGHRLYFGPHGANLWVLALLGGFALLSVGVDYLASVVGAAKGGASRKGMIGVVIGGLVGLFFSLPGILLGPFLGALIFEWVGGRPFKPAMKAGVGATLGMLAGVIGKLCCAGLMVLIFTIHVIFRSFDSLPKP
jgi:uncharacterized protein YqgC (DUF456 family)